MDEASVENTRRVAEAFLAAQEREAYAEALAQLAGNGEAARGFDRLDLEACLEAIVTARAQATKDADAEKTRRLDRLYSWLVREMTRREVRGIDARIAARGRDSVVSEIDGERRPLRDLRWLLAGSSDAVQRRALDEPRRAAALEQQALLAERVGVFMGVGRGLGETSYRALWARCTGADPAQLKELAEGVLVATDDMYREVFGWTVRRTTGLSAEDAARYDVPHVFAARYAAAQALMSPAELTRALRGLLEGIGLSLACEGRLTLGVEAASGRPHRATVCAFAIPGDVRLVTQLEDPQRDLRPLLGALGGALFLANIGAGQCFEDRWLGDGALDLTYRRIFEGLLLEEGFMTKGLGLGGARGRDLARLAQLENLYELRLACGRLLYELELYGGGALESMPALYEQTLRRAILVSTSPAFYLHDVREPFHSALQLRARLFECLFRAHLQHYFNADWWRNPRVGLFLKQEWGQGRRLTVEQRARELGYEQLGAEPALKVFERCL